MSDLRHLTEIRCAYQRNGHRCILPHGHRYFGGYVEGHILDRTGEDPDFFPSHTHKTEWDDLRALVAKLSDDVRRVGAERDELRRMVGLAIEAEQSECAADLAMELEKHKDFILYIRAKLEEDWADNPKEVNHLLHAVDHFIKTGDKT